MQDSELNKLVEDFLEEIQPFIDEANSEGIALFDASRIRDIERDLDVDDISYFHDELEEWLDSKDLSIEYTQYDQYELTHNDFVVCRQCGSAYKPLNRNYKYMGFLEDFQGEEYTFYQSDNDDEIEELRHSERLDDEFPVYLVKVINSDLIEVYGVTGFYLGDIVYRYTDEILED